MLKGAQHICDVALLYPIAGVWANFYPTVLSMYQPHPSKRLNEIDEQFLRLCRLLLQNQIDYDIVDERAIWEAKVEQGRFKIAGETYRALIVPSTDAIRLLTLKKIAELKRQGVLVVAVGEIPKFAASRNEDSGQVEKLAKQIFGNDAWFPASDSRLIQKLRSAGCGVLIEPQNQDLWVARFRRGNLILCFVVNTSSETVSVTVLLPNGRGASIWLPDSGEIQPAQVEREGAVLKVKISVPAFDSLFIVQGT